MSGIRSMPAWDRGPLCQSVQDGGQSLQWTSIRDQCLRDIVKPAGLKNDVNIMRSIESNYMTLLALEKRNQKWHKKQFLGKWDKMWLDYAKVGGKVNHFYFTKQIYPCLQVIWIINSLSLWLILRRYWYASIFLSVIEKVVKISRNVSFSRLALVAFTASELKRAVEQRKMFIMPGYCKKILPAQQPIRARSLL